MIRYFLRIGDVGWVSLPVYTQCAAIPKPFDMVVMWLKKSCPPGNGEYCDIIAGVMAKK